MPIAERREQLLDAALAVIVSDGYGRVSIDAIAKRAGVARSVVYGAFDDLDSLLLTLLDRQQERAFTRLLASLALPGSRDGSEGRAGSAAGADPFPEPDPDPDPDPASDPVGFACGAVHRMAAMLREDPDTWRLILIAPGATPPAVHARVEADRERFRRRVASWIASAAAGAGAGPADAGPPAADPAGPGAPAPDPEVLAHALVASAEHFARLALTSPGTIDTGRLTAQLRLLLGALWPAAPAGPVGR
ncbi:hypothetical protein SAVIM338S_00188 [Streptomyces avidinii]